MKISELNYINMKHPCFLKHKQKINKIKNMDDPSYLKKINFIMMKLITISIVLFAVTNNIIAQGQGVGKKLTDDNNNIYYKLKPVYPVPYEIMKEEQIIFLLKKIHHYLDSVTPASLEDKEKGIIINDYSKIDENVIFSPGDFRLISYEWGVTYSGMILAAKVTGDKRFEEYVTKRLNLIINVIPYYKTIYNKNPKVANPVRSIIEPKSLDDAGSMCAAIIKASKAKLITDADPYINNYIDYILNKEYRLTDGTLARNRPYNNTLWTDDLYMSVPALAQMGSYKDDYKCYDEAVKQVLQFSQRLFDHDKKLFMHGWVQDMKPHKPFYWGRANGWAIMAIVELLDVLPSNYHGREEILNILNEHVEGLAACQSGTGFWHQLLDKQDSYLETSATAIFTYSIARAINNGYLDIKAYGPMVLLAWNAVTTKINNIGQVEGTCIGTGMAFDPVFYYHRPISEYAAHGYGPVILAGSEIITLMRKFKAEINDFAIMFHSK
jgi:rhamnogalacturonyl hydrolase YesR